VRRIELKRRLGRGGEEIDWEGGKEEEDGEG
jgi:hypothetical protein